MRMGRNEKFHHLMAEYLILTLDMSALPKVYGSLFENLCKTKATALSAYQCIWELAEVKVNKMMKKGGIL